MIESVNSGSSQLALLQQLLKQQASESQSGSTSTSNPFRDQIASVLGQMGLDSSKISDLMTKIDSAVQTAMQNSSNSTDPRSAVASAINTVLENNGLDTTKFQTLMAQARPDSQKPAGNPLDAQFKAVAEALGLTSSQASDLKTQMDEAVQTALQNADGNSNPREAVESAIAGVLNDNGIDVEDFKTQMKAMADKMGLSKSGQGAGPGGTYGPPPPPQGGSTGDSTSTTSSSSDSNLSLLQQFLQQLSSAQDGNDSDTTSLLSVWQMLQNLPRGSLVNANV
jgi:anti-sigma regulatory factor (Ser/Thr protein kinase)